TAVVVWGAIPVVTITLYPGLSQGPQGLLEGGEIGGAPAWEGFRGGTLPLLKPVFIILPSLSIIWDFQVFNQVWIMLGERPSPDYYVMGIYAFVTGFRSNDYGLGAAIAVSMVLIMMVATLVYIRQMIKTGEVRWAPSPRSPRRPSRCGRPRAARAFPAASSRVASA